MADGLYYLDLKEPHITADIAQVTLAATNKALYPITNLPNFGGNYFSRPGKKLYMRLFGRMTTVATPGNLTMSVLWGTGADANGTSLAASTVGTLVANATALSWQMQVWMHCRAFGTTGTLLTNGIFQCSAGLIAATQLMLPAATLAAVTVDLTSATLFPIVQALRSGSTAETMQVHDMEVIPYN